MKLLVDENLSPALARELADLFPGSTHVNEVGLGSTPDEAIWTFAAANEFIFLKDRSPR